MITYKDIRVNSYEIDLCKLVGKSVKGIRGYLSREFGDVSFKLTNIEFDDDTTIGVEGKHDHPYLSDYPNKPQPNFDEETLARLYEESGEE